MRTWPVSRKLRRDVVFMVAPAVVAWLRDSAVQLRSVEAGDDDTDLHSLDAMFAGKRVVGLGESNHGAREFFQLKDRMFRFLVQELGFTAIAFEAPYATSLALDDYVCHGRGDVGSALSDLRYLPWDNEELITMLEWMRAFNSTASVERQVHFVGVDIHFAGAGAPVIRDLIGRVDPGRAASLEPVLLAVIASDLHFPNAMSDLDEDGLRAAVPALDATLDWLRADRDRMLAVSTVAEVDRVELALMTMREWCSRDSAARTTDMGRNLLTLLEQAPGDRKIVWWAHNCHVGRLIGATGDLSAGRVLGDRFGGEYLACTLQFRHGSFQSRSLDAQGRLAGLGVSSIGPPRVDSLPWVLHEAGLGDVVIDLDRPASNEVAAWLSAPIQERGPGWAEEDDPTGTYEDLTISGAFDAVVYIDHISPARPTTAARAHALNDRGL